MIAPLQCEGVLVGFDRLGFPPLLARAILFCEHDLIEPATSARDISTYTYRAGGSSLLELLDAQRAFNDTMQSYLDAQAGLRRAAARLNAAVGREVMR